MCIKTNLNKLRICKMNLKSIGLSYFIPIIANYIYIPIMIYLFYLIGNNNIEYAKYSSFVEMQHVIPYFSIWWLVFALREYIEGNSKELLKVYKKSLLFDSLFIFLWYVLHIYLIILTLSLVLGNDVFLLSLLLIVESAAFYSIAYFLLIVCRTISIPLLLCTLYEISYMYMNIDFANLNIVFLGKINHIFDILIPYGPILLGSILLFIVSNFIYNKIMR